MEITDKGLMNAVVLLSGGLDSATVLACAVADGYHPFPITFRYGQRHLIEVAAAHQVAAQVGVMTHVVDLDLRPYGSALTNPEAEIPKDRDLEVMDLAIPTTYVPARNTIFLAHALAYAELVDASDIFIGVNALDYSGYPDCRPEFIHAFERMARLATKAGVGGQHYRIRAPLIEMTKADIIRLGIELGVNYSLTFSCYDPVAYQPCGSCDSCLLRAKGFTEVGLPDPALT